MSPPAAIFCLPLERSIKLHFKDHNGNPIKTIEAAEGNDILTLAHEWEMDLEVECACEGSIACSTCHNDMLDLAFGLTDTSRLVCQVRVMKEMNGIEVRLPRATRNIFVDGKKPTYH
ncbi:hypothetical protein EDC04DRAFT_2869788 [Pisolithus marmoratus]|nr:hypothetical protein EDC04DRAFT_2870856 [Pisolithus marmoratus]KAI6022084.1 hypothetical protein EDC04DRAFT_2869788 [Pisolithus marmoratus]